MRAWVWPYVVAAAALAASGCAPNDVKVKTAKERLEAGQVVVFDRPGHRFKGCRASEPDWSELRLANQRDRSRVVLGRRTSLVGLGRRVCYRVGTNVALRVRDDGRADLGVAHVQRVAWVKLEFLKKEHLRGFGFFTDEGFRDFVQAFRANMRPEHDGIVNIVDFVYLSGTAVDEKTIIDEDAKGRSGVSVDEVPL